MLGTVTSIKRSGQTDDVDRHSGVSPGQSSRSCAGMWGLVFLAWCAVYLVLLLSLPGSAAGRKTVGGWRLLGRVVEIEEGLGQDIQAIGMMDTVDRERYVYVVSVRGAMEMSNDNASSSSPSFIRFYGAGKDDDCRLVWSGEVNAYLTSASVDSSTHTLVTRWETGSANRLLIHQPNRVGVAEMLAVPFSGGYAFVDIDGDGGMADSVYDLGEHVQDLL